jgi:hypothetical protein
VYYQKPYIIDKGKRYMFDLLLEKEGKMIILAYLVQASCNIRTAVPVLSGQWFLQYPDRIPVPSRQDDIYSLLYSFVPALSFTASAA